MTLTRQQDREKILYPVTRVRTKEAGGSGVIVYSKEDPKNPNRFINIVLTCEHVVDDAIKTKEDWDPVLKRSRKKDFFEEVTVDIFDYDSSTIISTNSSQADIIAYDKHHDMAAIRVHFPKEIQYTATLYPKDKIKDLQVFDPVWVSGCSLAHDPFASEGTLTYLREIMDQKAYLMQNAPAIFGNSGGGLFHGEEGYLLGLVSRVTVMQLGFGVDVLPWMSFSSHPDRLYEFFEYQELQFLYNDSDDFYSAMARREQRQKEALRGLLMDEKQSKDVIMEGRSEGK